MSKRVRSESPEVDVAERVQQLRAALGDASRLRRVLESALPDADERIVAFITAMSAYVPANFGQEQQPRSLPNESLLDVLGFLSRDDLDSAQLSCRRLRRLIQDEEEKNLALRSIKAAYVGKIDIFVDENLPADMESSRTDRPRRFRRPRIPANF